ncbi:MAG: hypothetical protein H7837_10045 [Magnetococcus sp. MYC-9]
MDKKSVVLLVDNRKRDLLGAALIAHHLQRLGIPCHLEPLEAYKAVLAVHKPAMIIFNHLLASHLVSYSKRLKKLGVLTAVLPNEGLIYNSEVLKFLAGRFHSEAHIDHYFCWHAELKGYLLESGFNEATTRMEVIGIPRFDYYFKPWSHLFEPLPELPAGKKRILLCTNFDLVRFSELPKSAADQFFSAWAPRIKAYEDYWGCIQSMQHRRQATPAYITALVETGLYEVVLRPHPSENIEFYQSWIASLPSNLQSHIRLDAKSNIARLILASDLTISVEDCTTTLESWIAGKPTISLIFDRHPMRHSDSFASLNVSCHAPQELPALVARELADPEQPAFAAGRQAHLHRWCAPLDGNTCQRVAGIIRDALATTPGCDIAQIKLEDHRRAAKLRIKSLLDLPYTFDPALLLKYKLFPKKYATRRDTVKKTIRPTEVRRILGQIARLDGTDR